MARGGRRDGDVDEVIDERERPSVTVVGGGQRPGEIGQEAGDRPDRADAAHPTDGASEPSRGVVMIDVGELVLAPADARPLGRARGARPDNVGGTAVEILAALVSIASLYPRKNDAITGQTLLG